MESDLASAEEHSLSKNSPNGMRNDSTNSTQGRRTRKGKADWQQRPTDGRIRVAVDAQREEALAAHHVPDLIQEQKKPMEAMNA